MENDDKLIQVKGDELLPGRVLDHAIARHIFGWKTWTFVTPSLRAGDSFKYDALVPPEYSGPDIIRADINMIIPSYSTDIAAAWAVLEKIGLTFELVWLRSANRCSIRLIDGDAVASAFADTAPHAICLAALQINT